MDPRWLLGVGLALLIAPALWDLIRHREVRRELWAWARRSRENARILVVANLEGQAHDTARHTNHSDADLIIETLSQHGYQPHSCHGSVAPRALRRGDYEVVLGDLMSFSLRGHELLRIARASSPRTQVILVGDATDTRALEAAEHGALAVLGRRFRGHDLLRRVEEACERAAVSGHPDRARHPGRHHPTGRPEHRGLPGAPLIPQEQPHLTA